LSERAHAEDGRSNLLSVLTRSKIPPVFGLNPRKLPSVFNYCVYQLPCIQYGSTVPLQIFCSCSAQVLSNCSLYSAVVLPKYCPTTAYILQLFSPSIVQLQPLFCSCSAQILSNYSLYSALKGKAIPVQFWTVPEGSRRLRLPDFVTFSV
jgi:hypothetical protein